MKTAANIQRAESAHWYHPDGQPCFELPKASGDGMRAPTVRDARKMNLLPSVTTILKVLHKEALVNWLIEQAVLAVVTTPRLPGEPEDAFIKRVLQDQKVQEEEAGVAREKGKQIHDALQNLFIGKEIEAHEFREWVTPCYNEISKLGTFLFAERTVIGPGYAGTADLGLINCDCIDLVDWKSTGRLPDRESWDEHKLQLSAYAKAVHMLYPDKTIRTFNAYISTKEKGDYKVFQNPNWEYTFNQGFTPILKYWQWVKDYTP